MLALTLNTNEMALFYNFYTSLQILDEYRFQTTQY